MDELTGVPAALEPLVGEELHKGRIKLDGACSLSVAISLRRIADALESLNNGEGFLVR